MKFLNPFFLLGVLFWVAFEIGLWIGESCIEGFNWAIEAGETITFIRRASESGD